MPGFYFQCLLQGCPEYVTATEREGEKDTIFQCHMQSQPVDVIYGNYVFHAAVLMKNHVLRIGLDNN